MEEGTEEGEAEEVMAVARMRMRKKDEAEEELEEARERGEADEVMMRTTMMTRRSGEQQAEGVVSPRVGMARRPC